MIRPILALTLALCGSPLLADNAMPFDALASAPRLLTVETPAFGGVTVRVVVAEDGRPIDCALREGDYTGACRFVMQRFRYAPAVDGRGRRVRAVSQYRFP